MRRSLLLAVLALSAFSACSVSGQVVSSRAALLAADGSTVGEFHEGMTVSSALAPEFFHVVSNLLTAEPAFGESPKDRQDYLLGGDISIETTIDVDMQLAAQSAIRSRIGPDERAAAVVITLDIASGEVLAVASGGNVEGYPAGLPVAALVGRPTGSAFKPIALARAVEDGIDVEALYPAPECVLVPNPTLTEVCGGTGTPMTLHNATVRSINTLFTGLMDELGPQRVVDLAFDLGIRTSPLEPSTLAVLGLNPVTVLEMASVYRTFAAGGEYLEPVLIRRVRGPDEEVLWEANPAPERVLTSQTAATITAVLTDVVLDGTGRGAQLDVSVAGKTGTSLNVTDAWFIGYTDRLITAVWVGIPDDPDRVLLPPATSERVVGSTWPTEIWRLLMSRIG
ncbi:MAG: penicillin-binding transpeptidase domain-containing protein [Acidimicrobiia bacterium]|nr:penicillin-binding transpeptidase domain-containing protein [Acidimicrobiia bacterium]